MAKQRTNQAPPEGWAVTSQAPDQLVIDEAGDPQRGTRVQFVTGLGERGSVFVPEHWYRANIVRDMINEKARLIDHIGTLTSESLILE